MMSADTHAQMDIWNNPLPTEVSAFTQGQCEASIDDFIETLWFVLV